jgi:hypothetical protein
MHYNEWAALVDAARRHTDPDDDFAGFLAVLWQYAPPVGAARILQATLHGECGVLSAGQ